MKKNIRGSKYLLMLLLKHSKRKTEETYKGPGNKGRLYFL